MDNKTATTGNFGPKVRSDCQVILELTSSGGIQMELKSKVKVLYGNSNKKLIEEIIRYFNIENANIVVDDKGALPFVIAARVEAAIKKLVNSDKEFLLDLIDENRYSTTRDKFRFSRLYLPGNIPSMMLNAGIHKPDGIILDLEDSVALEKKEEAQLLVRNALRQVRFYDAERMVRINQFPRGIDDLKFIVPHNVNLILVPKCEDASQIIELESKITEIKELHNIDRPIYLMPIIESCLGVEKAYEIATSSENIVAIAIGLEDYTADLGAKRTIEAKESFYARTRIVNACKAASIQAIDSVFSDVSDMEALRHNASTSKSLGFEGMGCIHPRQIKTIHEAFAPEAKEIEKAKKIVLAFDDATAKGLGVVSLGSKMIDPPVVKRAEKTIKLALNLGLISKEWRAEDEN